MRDQKNYEALREKVRSALTLCLAGLGGGTTVAPDLAYANYIYLLIYFYKLSIQCIHLKYT